MRGWKWSTMSRVIGPCTEETTCQLALIFFDPDHLAGVIDVGLVMVLEGEAELAPLIGKNLVVDIQPLHTNDLAQAVE